MSFGGLTFLAPLALLGLIGLPLVWWILRISPPKPKQESFPPLRILQDIETGEETPAGTPLWLLLFRLLLVALVAVALAKPLLQSAAPTTAKPLTLLLDRSVLSTPDWDDMLRSSERLIKDARRENLDVRLITQNGSNADYAPAADALARLKTLEPLPYLAPINTEFSEDNRDARTVLISSGLTANPAPLGIEIDEMIAPAVQRLILPAGVRETATGFSADFYRTSGGPNTANIEAISASDAVLAVEQLTFTPGDTLGTAEFALPPQLRARVAKLRVAGLRSAASTKLLDDAFGRPLVGVLTPPADTASPLLSEPFYAKQALAPYADIFEGDLETLLALQPSILIMPDSQRSEGEAVTQFVEDGGVLIRFAGPRLAQQADSLLPVLLRSGGRAIGGALAWEDPQRLAPFTAESPFSGLIIPPEVTVSKQVMAEPGIQTDTKTWARLEDGSPIVTSEPRGSGRIVLFHVTAGPDWSNLALSGLYVDMLRRILPLAKGRVLQTSESEADWRADRVLDAFGRLGAPALGLDTIAPTEFAAATASAQTPPGYYRQGTRQRALLAIANPQNVAAITLPNSVTRANFGGAVSSTLTGKLLALAALMLAIDVIFSLFVSGRTRYLRPRAAIAAGLAASLFVLTPATSEAQDTTQKRIMEATSGLHLAYIETGDARIDGLSEAALSGVKTQLTGRTTIEPIGVHGVRADDAALELYPFLYWPVRRDSSALTAEEKAGLNAYMASGGTLVIDTADEGDRALRGTAPHPGLARVTEGLDIPALVDVPENHVLTKSFYLLQTFAGRWGAGPVYVARANNSAGGRDGVSSVIIGSQDWAAGWAVDESNAPILEINNDVPRQREMSARFGVNLVMYTLSGNYKADQVHAAALIERLGREAPAAPKASE